MLECTRSSLARIRDYGAICQYKPKACDFKVFLLYGDTKGRTYESMDFAVPTPVVPHVLRSIQSLHELLPKQRG